MKQHFKLIAPIMKGILPPHRRSKLIGTTVMDCHTADLSHQKKHVPLPCSTVRAQSFNITQHPDLICYYMLNRDKENITSEMSTAIAEKMKISLNKDVDPYTLKNKITLLYKLGCDFDQIFEQPDILLVEEKELKTRKQKLEQCNFKEVSVHLLKKAQGSSLSGIKQQCHSHTRGMDGHSSHTAFLMSYLQCDSVQLATVLSRFPKLLRMELTGRNSSLKLKIHLLLNEGIPVGDIRNTPQVLSKGYFLIKKRIQEMKRIGVDSPLPLTWISQNESRFQQLMDAHSNERTVLNGRSKLEALASMLNVDIELIRNDHAFHHMSVVNLKSKIDHLLLHGVDGQLLAEHSYILCYSLTKLKHAMEQLRNLGIDHMLPLQIYWMMTMERISKPIYARSTLKQHKFFRLLHLTKCDSKDRVTRKLGHLLEQPITELEKKIDIFCAYGFGVEVIKECPLVLGHDVSYINKYLSSLPQQKELQPYNEWLEEPVKLLNACQYLMERGVNFSTFAITRKDFLEDEVVGQSIENKI